MDETVNDFLNEIDQLVPPKEKKSECVWQECIDENSGYPYYWNINTNQVTWEMPSEYKNWVEERDKKFSHKTVTLTNNVPSNPDPIFPITKDSVKIYKIESENSTSTNLDQKSEIKPVVSKSKKKSYRTCSDSDEEKIVLISSYGDDSEKSDSEDDEDTSETIVTNFTPRLENNSKSSSPNLDSQINSDDEALTKKLQQRVQVLKELGGVLPSDLQTIIDKPYNESKVKQKSKTAISGFSLLASYGDSDEEIEDNIEKNKTKSCLFPITKEIDVKQFISETDQKPKIESNAENVDPKVFQRKRRIGVDLINTKKRVKNSPDRTFDTTGFGYQGTSEYPGFKSGGVLFVKSDVLNPNDNVKTEEHRKESISKDMETAMLTLKEKLKFLSEGHSELSPVQVIIIQLDTLYTAMTGGGLSMSYFQKYLEDTSSDIIRLEKEAAPNGWLLQWDRSNKRYYYRNQESGETQWEYPQPDIIEDGDAMDISLTPSRADDEEESRMSLLTPPLLHSPPKISTTTKINETDDEIIKTDPPLPPPETDLILPPLPPENIINHGEPLPPGVDVSESVTYKSQENVSDYLSSALHSFYNDIAAIETNQSVVTNDGKINDNPQPVAAETIKKKKKNRVKVTQGIAMKKKGVSKLVEKWKNVQKNYD